MYLWVCVGKMGPNSSLNASLPAVVSYAEEVCFDPCRVYVSALFLSQPCSAQVTPDAVLHASAL